MPHRMVTLVAFLAVSSVYTVLPAGTHYVRADASGRNNGTDWTDAWTTLPARLVRGDTYYVADGFYGVHDFADPPSGETVITVKKATAADHGTNAGWNVSFGDGAAVFANIAFSESYYVFDGVTGRDDRGHGFEIFNEADRDTTVALVRLKPNVSHLHLAHVRIHRPSPDHRGVGIYAVRGGNRGIDISSCYIHDLFGVHLYFDGADRVTIDRCRMARNKSTTAVHSESIQARGTTNLTIRYSWFEDIQGTGVIVSGSGVSSDWAIHGNVFHATRGFAHGNGHGTIADNFNDSIRNVAVFNNTFVGIRTGKAGVRFWRSAGNCSAANNLYYDCRGVGYVGATHDYELFSSCGLIAAELRLAPRDVVTSSAPPFIDLPGADFRLRSGTAPGRADLARIFAGDPDGATRGGDGVWDRGAYEFTATPPLPDIRPPADVGVRP